MKQSANRSENLPSTNENEDLEGLNQNRWTFFEREDSLSSGSSVPDNINLIDGEIEIIQRNKSVTKEDKILPGTALHKLKVSDRDRKLLSKCSSVSTDWAIEMESCFLKGSQLVVRKSSPGSTFSHCYDNQGAFDVLVIRAHLTAKSGNTNFDGFFCRRQKLSSPLERSQAFKNLEAARRRTPKTSHFKKLSDTNAPSVSAVEQLNAGGDVRIESNKFPSHRPLSNSGNETASRGNTNPPEGIPGPSSAAGDSEPTQLERESKTFNEGSNVNRSFAEVGSSPQTSSNTAHQQPSNGNARRKPKVGLPDPKKVPKAVLDVRDFDDVLANKKVIDYLNHLEEGAGEIDNYLENNIDVSEEDINSLNSAAAAILREYGYNFPETTRVKKTRRYTRKKRGPRDEADTTSESDVSDSELKSEVVKRAIEGRDFSGLLDLLKNSKEWKESVKDDWTSESRRSGKIERKIQQDHS